MNLDLNLGDFKDDDFNEDCEMIEEISRRNDIAIIGFDAKVGSAVTKEEIWQAFFNGCDMISDFPEQRREDAQNFAKYTEGHIPNKFIQKAYLPRIDQFDADIFRIAPIEATAMDPTQRILIESIWSAIEDAGYAREGIYGTRTGVYIGYNAINSEYQLLFSEASSDILGVAVSGNVSSYLATRISYLLDLSGPAIVIDTACSSSLVALHTACRALRNSEIDTAIVGSIRIYICPELLENSNIGINSSSGRTKTFDEAADGTGGGEGVISLILKPLDEAISSNDHIYGIIKGSSVNQNGTSIGITAPKSNSQENVIIEAWNDAHIDPDKISYMEAHGTATNLGDPVEIGGITGAFRRVTDKKQFCAIGAAKSNFGHLDCASGLLGIAKVILMMENRWIPPTVHFYSPNRKINYIDSPVFINDKGREWKTDDGVLLAGISSFGISGTNCHVIMQSPPEVISHKKINNSRNILTASAMDKETLKKLLISYQKYLIKNHDIDFESFCYTANTGRKQYKYRFAAILGSLDQFINMTESDMMSDEYCSSFDLFNDHDELQIYKNRYLKGEETDFSEIYEENEVRKLSIPTYPFNNKRYWYEPDTYNKKFKNVSYSYSQKVIHPLIDNCSISSYNLKIYEKWISIENCSEIRSHKINGLCVMPGTVYVEIVYVISQMIFKGKQVNFDNITFFTPMTCYEDEKRLLHVIVNIDKSQLHIKMLSRSSDSDEWVFHAEANASTTLQYHNSKKISIESLISKFEAKEINTYVSGTSKEGFVKVGDQWNNISNIYMLDDELLIKFDVSDKYEEELSKYHLYPYVLDGSVNSGNALLKEVHLPLNYKNMIIWKDIPKKMYSHIKKLPVISDNEEVAMFNIELYDEYGEQIGVIEEYTLKLVNNKKNFLKELQISKNSFYQLKWEEKIPEYNSKNSEKLSFTVIMCIKEQLSLDIIQDIKNSSVRTEIICLIDSQNDPTGTMKYECSSDEEIYIALEELGNAGYMTIISLIPYSIDEDNSYLAEQKLKNTFDTAKALCKYADRHRLCFGVIGLNASSITEAESEINPINQASIGFYSCIGMEQNKIDICIIDTDKNTDFELLKNEIKGSHNKIIIGYRNNQRYIKKLKHFQKALDPIETENGDTIVIAGGFGGIGLAISEYLFNEFQNLNIILLSRNGIINEDDVRTTKFKALKSAGNNIEIVQADISDRQQTNEAIEQIRKNYGNIKGIILAAGIAGDGMLINKSWAQVLKVIRPKISGAFNLDEATKNDDLKYFVMFSSFTGIFGAPGQTDYTAANAFLDSFAFERTRRCKKTITIDWTGWKEAGMAYNYNVNSDSSILKFVTNEEGYHLFKQALKIGYPQILAGEFMKDNINESAEELQKNVELPTDIIANIKSENGINMDDLVISGKFSGELTEIERNVALAWARTLGIKEINIYDKFFEIGGSSLLASFLQKEVDKFYPDILAIADTFIYSTVSEMSAYISRKIGVKDEKNVEKINENSDVESLVQQFMDGELNIDELGKMI